MKKIEPSKLKTAIIVLIIFAAIVGWTIWFCWSHPTYYAFNDKFIIGNTKERIIKRYGEPNTYASDGSKLWYRIKDKYEDVIFDEIFYDFEYEAQVSYVIKFDENGIATEVYIYKQYD